MTIPKILQLVSSKTMFSLYKMNWFVDVLRIILCRNVCNFQKYLPQRIRSFEDALVYISGVHRIVYLKDFFCIDSRKF